MKINKQNGEVLVESVGPTVVIKYGKREFFKVDLIDLLYKYFYSKDEGRSRTQIKKVFGQGGVDLQLKVVVGQGEEVVAEVVTETDGEHKQ